jgi:hypothetical protein
MKALQNDIYKKIMNLERVIGCYSATSLLSTPIEMASFDWQNSNRSIKQRQEERALQTVNAAVVRSLG